MTKFRSRSHSRFLAFTLIELLVVIAIIAVLAGLLLPVLAIAKTKTKISAAKQEMKNFETAVNQYESTYSRPPGVSPGGGDFTFGTPFGTNSVPTNSDLMIIMMDLNTGINLNHVKNPQKAALFNAKPTSTTNAPGMSIVDNQLRDPWGKPYVITIDFDGDGYCQDSFYSQAAVSQQQPGSYQGYNGLQDYNKNNLFLLHSSVQMWSSGPDGQATNAPAKSGVNKDNVLSWQ